MHRLGVPIFPCKSVYPPSCTRSLWSRPSMWERKGLRALQGNPPACRGRLASWQRRLRCGMSFSAITNATVCTGPEADLSPRLGCAVQVTTSISRSRVRRRRSAPTWRCITSSGSSRATGSSGGQSTTPARDGAHKLRIRYLSILCMFRSWPLEGRRACCIFERAFSVLGEDVGCDLRGETGYRSVGRVVEAGGTCGGTESKGECCKALGGDGLQGVRRRWQPIWTRVDVSTWRAPKSDFTPFENLLCSLLSCDPFSSTTRPPPVRVSVGCQQVTTWHRDHSTRHARRSRPCSSRSSLSSSRSRPSRHKRRT